MMMGGLGGLGGGGASSSGPGLVIPETPPEMPSSRPVMAPPSSGGAGRPIMRPPSVVGVGGGPPTGAGMFRMQGTASELARDLPPQAPPSRSSSHPGTVEGVIHADVRVPRQVQSHFDPEGSQNARNTALLERTADLMAQSSRDLARATQEMHSSMRQELQQVAQAVGASVSLQRASMQAQAHRQAQQHAQMQAHQHAHQHAQMQAHARAAPTMPAPQGDAALGSASSPQPPPAPPSSPVDNAPPPPTLSSAVTLATPADIPTDAAGAAGAGPGTEVETPLASTTRVIELDDDPPRRRRRRKPAKTADDIVAVD